MTRRVLPYEEWSRLDGTIAASVTSSVNPDEVNIVVVEQDGEIVGYTVLFHRWVGDLIWLHPDHRQGGVARQLFRGVQEWAQTSGATLLLIPVTLAVMKRFCEKVGAIRLPSEIYVWALRQASF